MRTKLNKIRISVFKSPQLFSVVNSLGITAVPTVTGLQPFYISPCSGITNYNCDRIMPANLSIHCSIC